MTTEQLHSVHEFIRLTQESLRTPQEERWLDRHIDAVYALTIHGKLSLRRHFAICKWRHLSGKKERASAAIEGEW